MIYRLILCELEANHYNAHNTIFFPATHFGIALPKWIVEKQNSVWVLAVYGLVFMVILPVVVVSILRKRLLLMILQVKS